MRRCLVVAWCLPLLACAGVGQESLLITEEDEIAMGAQYHQQLLAQMPEYQGDPRIGEYIRGMGAEIALQSDRPNLQHTFTVVGSEEINAFAVPGGFVYVTMGLLRSATSGAEVASVIAHELGHISARHGVRSLEIYVLAENLGALLGGQNWGELISASIQTGTGLLFSQDQEVEADFLGVDYAYRTGYNPWGMVDFFSYLQKLEGPSTSTGIDASLGELFSTHPPTNERIANTEAQLADLGVGRDSNSLRWDTGTSYDELAAILPTPSTAAALTRPARLPRSRPLPPSAVPMPPDSGAAR